jgi:hypothetical protein
MVDNRSVVEQAHEIHTMAKELELVKCVLPDKFVAGCIIEKLSPSWRGFDTALKHKRQEYSVEGLIASFDVEEKARKKIPRLRAMVGSPVPMLCTRPRTRAREIESSADHQLQKQRRTIAIPTRMREHALCVPCLVIWPRRVHNARG